MPRAEASKYCDAWHPVVVSVWLGAAVVDDRDRRDRGGRDPISIRCGLPAQVTSDPAARGRIDHRVVRHQYFGVKPGARVTNVFVA